MLNTTRDITVFRVMDRGNAWPSIVVAQYHGIRTQAISTARPHAIDGAEHGWATFTQAVRTLFVQEKTIDCLQAILQQLGT